MADLLIFAYYGYYPHGGANDLVGQADSVFDAEVVLKDVKAEYAHAFSVEDNKVVVEWARAYSQEPNKEFMRYGPWERLP